jgi:hypothetical protein
MCCAVSSLNVAASPPVKTSFALSRNSLLKSSAA